MALRLRRGTDAQRLLITPQEGELIYTTDTNEIFVGDGVTAGGIRVTGLVPENIEDLQNVSSSVPGDNDVLIWDALTAQWTPIPLDTIAPGSTLASLTDVDLTSGTLVNGGILTYDSGAGTWGPTDTEFFIPNLLPRDIKGSVFADDSTLVVDGLTGTIYASNIIAYDAINISATDPITEVNIYSEETRSRMNFYTTSYDPGSDLSSYTGNYATVNFGYEDDTNGSTVLSTIRGSDADIRIAHDLNSGFLTDESKYFTAKDGNFGFGTYTPTAKLDVRGNASVSGEVEAAAFKGSLVGDDSRIVVDGLTGFVYADHFVAYDQINFSPTDDILEMNIYSYGNRSRQNFYVTSEDPEVDLSTYTGYYATVNFGYEDSINGANVRGTIRGSDTDIRIAHDVNEGFLTDESKYFTAKDGNFGFGTYTPDYKVDVRGDLRADALIGALYADDSTLVVDGFNGAVYASELTTSVINTQTNDLSISNPGGITEIHIESQGNRSRQNFYVTAPDEVTDLSTYTGYYATINFGYTDTPNGATVRGTIRGSDTDIRLAHDVNEGFLADETKYFTVKDGNFGFGTYTPEAKVDVRGPILPGRYADAAARDAAIPTPVAGMTIFVTDGDGAGNPKFQGNTDGTTGGWVDLN